MSEGAVHVLRMLVLIFVGLAGLVGLADHLFTCLAPRFSSAGREPEELFHLPMMSVVVLGLAILVLFPVLGVYPIGLYLVLRLVFEPKHRQQANAGGGSCAFAFRFSLANLLLAIMTLAAIMHWTFFLLTRGMDWY